MMSIRPSITVSVLIFLAIAYELLVLGFAILGPAGRNYPNFLILYTLLYLLYLFGYYCIKANTGGNGILPVIILSSVLFHVSLLLANLQLSDDIFRYLWDGKLLSNGINPFAYKPEDPGLVVFQDENYARMAYKNYYTIYPPLTQFFFGLCYLISPTVTAFRFLFLIFDIGTMLVVYKLLQINHLNRSNIILYAWNPLVIIEFAGAGHYDSMGIFFLLAALLLFLNNRLTIGVFSLAASVLTKLIPVLAIPYVFKKLRLKGVILIISTVFLLYLPFSNNSVNPFGSLQTYYEIWRFNDFAFSGMLAIVEWFGATDTLEVTKRSAGILLLLWMGYLFLRGENRGWQLEKKIFYCLFALLLISPTLHPWYLTWIVPFFALYPRMSYLVLSYTIVFAYSVLTNDYFLGFESDWAETSNHKWLEFVPFYLLLIVEVFVRRQTRSSS